MQSELRMERRRLSDLLPAEYNPRVTLGPEDKEFQDLVTSIRTLGYAEPILINEDGTIIGGHQRYNALLYLGWALEKYKSRTVWVRLLFCPKVKILLGYLNVIVVLTDVFNTLTFQCGDAFGVKYQLF